MSLNSHIKKNSIQTTTEFLLPSGFAILITLTQYCEGKRKQTIKENVFPHASRDNKSVSI
jgi:hypothetical protein